MQNDQSTQTVANTGPGCIHDDVLTLRELAQAIKSHPAQKATAAAIEAVARIADDLAHRLDAIEAAEAQRKPCEGCGGAGGAEISGEQAAAIQEMGGQVWEVLNKHEPEKAATQREKMRGLLNLVPKGAI